MVTVIDDVDGLDLILAKEIAHVVDTCRFE
jgi:hypothetical protein